MADQYKITDLPFMDMMRMMFRIFEFKYEQNKLQSKQYEIVQTTKGPVKGVKRKTIWGDDYYSFEGIPYAKPPINELRFLAPVPVEPWTQALDCTSWADVAMQTNMICRKYKGSEDCLYLNVFTKDFSTPLRPVMVWIHGGAFQIGEATREQFSPDFLMSRNIVLVTVAYRLGPFGFLSFNDPAVNVPGNAGLKDQILALRWVPENIALFGGDPKNLTLFGESAGGVSTHHLILSPQCRGLVHKAIIMSGSALCPWGVNENENFGYRLAEKLGYTGPEDDMKVYKFLLCAKASELVLAAGPLLNKMEKHHRVMFAFGPVVEPYDTPDCVISKHPFEAMKTTWSNDIPLLIGGNSYEGLLFYKEIQRRPKTLEESNNCRNLLPIEVKQNCDEPTRIEYANQLKELYFGAKGCTRETPMEYLLLESHREFWHPIYRTVNLRRKYARAPTFLYRFDFDSREANCVRNLIAGRNVQGVCHGDDLYYLWFAMFSHRHVKDTPEYRTTCTMVDMMTSFAAKSDPNCASFEHVRFEPVPKKGEVKCLNISYAVEFKELPEMEKLQVWNSFYPDEDSSSSSKKNVPKINQNFKSNQQSVATSDAQNPKPCCCCSCQQLVNASPCEKDKQPD